MEIIKSLHDIPEIEIYGCDTDPLNVGSCWAKESFLAPPLSDKNFWPFLEKIVEKKKINLIYPTHDWFLHPFAKKKKISVARFMVPDEETVRITRSKELTYEYFKNIIPVPKVYKLRDVRKKDYPLFIKPEAGRGSERAFKIENKRGLQGLYRAIEKPILMAYLPGKEYTVDCICNLEGKLLVASIRERIKIIRGISAIAKIVENESIQKMAQKITENLKIKGSWFFQVRENKEGLPTLLEINTRIGGTLSLTRVAGVNIPYLAVLIFSGQKINRVPPPKVGITVTRYLNEEYLCPDFKNIRCIAWDLDDTLWYGRCLEDKIKPKPEIDYVLKELKKKGFILSVVSKSPHLIGLDKNKIKVVMRNNGISPEVFSEIIINDKRRSENLRRLTKKFKIRLNQIIYVDDSFTEREEVRKNSYGVWVFDSQFANELLNLHKG